MKSISKADGEVIQSLKSPRSITLLGLFVRGINKWSKQMEINTMEQKFKEDDRVVYVPLHANGDQSHPDCETGRVTTIGRKYIFVSFDGRPGIACDPDDLVSLEKK